MNLQVVGDSIITITSRGNTNLFNNPNGNDNDHNAPMLLFHPDSDFVLSAKITADLKEEYDVASLVMFQDNDLWAKLCFENSYKMERNVVSVVTKKYSDDCNSVKIYKNFGYFLIAKKGEEFSFHYSIDNKNWDLIRHFRLKSTDLMIGFAVQCYSSKSFYASFSDIKYSNTSLEDMRNYK